ncbi:hypothetical protein B0H14DRAFT_2639465 [Mycena olivaceomarginata]|nr:hypothetical protein B0H14DRAFT_2639465 [Mycena olivaceomarginata]
MSASHRKDRVAALGIWKAPPNVSKEAFETKITSIVDSLLAIPVAQKNYLKFDMVLSLELCSTFVQCSWVLTQILQNGASNQHLKALGLPEAPLSVWLTCECAVGRRCVQIASNVSSIADRSPFWEGAQTGKDATIVKLFAEAQEFVSCADIFCVDIVTRLDVPTPTTRAHMMCSFRCPGHLTSNQYGPKFESFVDRLLALPIIQQNVLKYSLMVAHPDIKDYVRDAMRELDIHLESSIFSADVVSKISK